MLYSELGINQLAKGDTSLFRGNEVLIKTKEPHMANIEVYSGARRTRHSADFYQ